MANGKLFFGGLPTDPEIKRLMDAFPESEMKVGDKFSYDRVSEVISAPYGSNRFRTITNRWRNIVEKRCGLFIGIPPDMAGEGFRVLSEQEKLELACRKHGTVVTGIRRTSILIASTDRSALASDEDKKFYDLLHGRNAAMIASAQIRNKTKMLPEV